MTGPTDALPLIAELRGAAVDAVVALTSQLSTILVIADLAASQGHDVSKGELRAVLMRLIHTLHRLRLQLLGVDVGRVVHDGAALS